MTAGIIIIYLATLTGLALVNRIRPVVFRLLVLLLVLTAFNETWLTVPEHQVYTTLHYNIFSLVEICIWSVILLNINGYTKNVIFYLIPAIILIASVIEIYLRPGFHSYSYRAFSLYAIISCMICFYRLAGLKSEVKILFNGSFWILTGLLLFQFVFAFYLTALDIPEFRTAPDAQTAFRSVFNIINISYYLLLLYGFLCLSFYQR